MICWGNGVWEEFEFILNKKIMDISKDLKPITDILWIAVIDSQKLEYDLAFMSLLSNQNIPSLSQKNDDLINDHMESLSKKTLWFLIKNIKKYIEVNENFIIKLENALDARNYIIHNFLHQQWEKLLKKEWRKEALEELKIKRNILKDCHFFLDPYIQLLAQARGMNLSNIIYDVKSEYENTNWNMKLLKQWHTLDSQKQG